MNLSPSVSATAATSNGAKPAAAGNAEADAASTFDNILALETIAAASPTLDVTGLEDMVVQEDGEGDEGEDGIEDLLGFLTSLMNATMPASALPAVHANAGAANDASVEALGSALQGYAGNAEAADPAALTAGAAGENGTDAGDGKLPVAPGLAGAFMDATSANTEADGVDAAAPARGADWLQPAARQAVAEPHRIATPVRDPRWAEEFGTRIALMVRGGESTAALQLSPVELGPMDVSVTVRDSQASIHFGAAQAETRALIEASIPRLREMLAAQGFHLMDASVSQGFSRQAQPDPQVTQTSGTEAEGDESVRQVQSLGLLDLYA